MTDTGQFQLPPVVEPPDINARRRSVKNRHKHSDGINGFQMITSPPDDGSDPERGDEVSVGGHKGIVIDPDPYNVKWAQRERMQVNLPADPGTPGWKPSREDIRIQTKILNKRLTR